MLFDITICHYISVDVYHKTLLQPFDYDTVLYIYEF